MMILKHEGQKATNHAQMLEQEIVGKRTVSVAM